MKMKNWKSKSRKIGNHVNENENKQESVSKNSANPFTRDFNSNIKEVRK